MNPQHPTDVPGTGDPTGGAAETAAPADHAGLAVLCDHLAALASTLPGPLGRVSLSLGAASVEVAWQEPAAVAAAAAAPARSAPTPAPGAPHLAAAPVPEEVEEAEEGSHQVTAPLVGTFYAAPSPGAPAFVAVGEMVEVGQTLGIVEAMKLMNPIVADVAGRVARLLVGDGQPVEFDQPLVLVETGAATTAGDTVLARVG